MDFRKIEVGLTIFELIIFTPGGLGTASEKSVGGESVPTILDKCDVQYSTLIFSLRSTWAGPKAVISLSV